MNGAHASPAIRITGLGKTYKVWAHPRDLLVEAVLGRRRHSEFRALSDISFDVWRGTVVGLLGRNGAGKSTLLRIITGTLDATSGKAVVDGRVSAILELGTGFHPDYTGRENVFLGGLCLGLDRSAIARRFDEIVDFAELRDFIDQPFRTYSSGMQARLTFAVATAVDPDVLIIDEALGVGDARFQLKSFDRIRRFKEQGKTILLVSHSITQVVAICDRAILLDRGQVVADGDPNAVGNLYHEMLFGPAGPQSLRIADAARPAAGEQPEAAGDDAAPTTPPAEPQQDERERRYGLRQAEIASIAVEDESGRRLRSVRSLGQYRLVLEITAHAATGPLHFGFILRDMRGFEVVGWDTGSSGSEPLPPFTAGERRRISLDFRCSLAAGTFFVTAALAQLDATKEDMRFDALELVVEPTPDLHSSSLVNLDVRYAASADGGGIMSAARAPS